MHQVEVGSAEGVDAVDDGSILSLAALFGKGAETGLFGFLLVDKVSFLHRLVHAAKVLDAVTP